MFTYIWLTFMVNVGKYTTHEWYGCDLLSHIFFEIIVEGDFCTTGGKVGVHVG